MPATLNNQTARRFLIGFFGLWTLLSLWGLGFYLLELNAYLGCEKWPSTQGKILSSVVLISYSSKSRTPRFSPGLSYAYQVGSRQYTGSQLAFRNPRSSQRLEIETVLQAYPVNQVVKVYYKPEQPERAVLLPGLSQADYLAALAPGSFGLIGILGLLWAWKKRDSGPTTA